MKSNKKNNLLTNLFKSYIIQCVIWTGIIVVVAIILGAVLQKVLDKYVPNYYLVYRSLYLGIAAIVILAICIIRLTYKLLKKVVAYVDELQHAIGQIFDKDVNYVKLSPELADIAIKLNHLKQESENNARLAKENEQRKNDLIMYLAHDLKTPLSSVIGYLTLLRDETQISKELQTKYLSIALDKAERLEDLINEFFEITRFNLSNITLQYSKINLTRLLEQLVYEFKPLLKEKNLTCNLKIQEDITLRCDANKIQRVFDNLLRNAAIYSFHDTEILISQLKFLYPLKTLAFPAFSPPRFGPFPSFFPLREEMRETFFRPSLQPYPEALRKFAWPLWWHGRKCSSWYLHQNVPAAPVHPWVLPREREGWSYMYASTDGNENHPYPRPSFGSIGTHC